MTSRRALLLAALVACGARPAGAHSLLLGATPAPDAVLAASPPAVELRFNNRIETRLSRVRLVDARGTVARAPTAPAGEGPAQDLRAVVPPLTPGTWRVEWQVFSTDGHVVTGSYQFRVAP